MRLVSKISRKNFLDCGLSPLQPPASIEFVGPSARPPRRPHRIPLNRAPCSSYYQSSQPVATLISRSCGAHSSLTFISPSHSVSHQSNVAVPRCVVHQLTTVNFGAGNFHRISTSDTNVTDGAIAGLSDPSIRIRTNQPPKVLARSVT